MNAIFSPPHITSAWTAELARGISAAHAAAYRLHAKDAGRIYYLLDMNTGFCYEAVEIGNQLAALKQSECDGGADQKFRFFFPN